MKKIIAVLLALLILPFSVRAQTMPEVDDPRIEARWIHQSEADAEAILEQDVIGQEAINILIFGDGFTESTKEEFFSYCVPRIDFFVKKVPQSEKFNLIAVWLPSVDDGIDIPSEGVVKDTPLDGVSKLISPGIFDDSELARFEFDIDKVIDDEYLERFLQREKKE